MGRWGNLLPGEIKAVVWKFTKFVLSQGHSLIRRLPTASFSPERFREMVVKLSSRFLIASDDMQNYVDEALNTTDMLVNGCRQSSLDCQDSRILWLKIVDIDLGSVARMQASLGPTVVYFKAPDER